ncbi:hypothetical protein ACFC26_22000 [Kitasatospora purpeofusca]|uniref:hypothetical protein n=1 Tax=Kitasatospora purpeofusca TaxID=67352 RepID=UPI0035D72DE3
MITALMLSPYGTVSEEVLEDRGAGYMPGIRTLLNGSVNPGSYLRGTKMWIPDAPGAHRPNTFATALASAWRGQDLSTGYWLHGPILLTGVDADDRPIQLPSKVPTDVRALQALFHRLQQSWVKDGVPSNDEAWRQVLDGAFEAIRDSRPA